ncbi:MAG TPA: V-type ATP synthase subunit F [Anaerolineales bacterium]|nr:V-type ATP synthase subunit F [Anaerolineales bacterium]
MKVLVIGHREAVLGFSLAGVNGQAVSTAEEADKALNEALASKDVGIILVTQDIAQLLQERVEDLKLHSTIPLVVEIPSPAGVPEDQPSLSEVVLKAIGIKL